jgi:excisionase family DNA binding protein
VVNDQDSLISVKDAARECGKNPETVRRWIWSGKLPAEKLGNQLYVRRTALEGFLREASATVEPDLKAAVAPAALQDGAAVSDGSGTAGEPAAVVKGGRVALISRMSQLRQEIRNRAGNLDLESDTDQTRKERMG